MAFAYQHGAWRIDLVDLVGKTEPALQQMAVRSGLPEDEFILQLIRASGVPNADASIWQPPVQP